MVWTGKKLKNLSKKTAEEYSPSALVYGSSNIFMCDI